MQPECLQGEALHRAALEGDDGEVRRLLQAGAKVHSVDSTGSTALHCAARTKSSNGCSAQLLLRWSAAVDARDHAGNTALAIAVANDDCLTLRHLLKARANPERAVAQGSDSPLLVASKHSAASVVRALLAGRAAPDCQATDGTTPLHAAAAVGCLEAIELLVSACANPNAANGDGVEPLLLAVRGGHPVAVAALMAAGACPDASPPTGGTAGNLAARLGDTKMVHELVQMGASVEACHLTSGRRPPARAAAARKARRGRFGINSQERPCQVARTVDASSNEQHYSAPKAAVPRKHERGGGSGSGGPLGAAGSCISVSNNGTWSLS